MRGTLTGSFDALTRFGSAVASLGSTRRMAELSRELGAEVVRLAEQGFAKEQDPYGIAWARKRFPDGRKTLQGATGKLAKSFGIKAVGAWGVVVASNLERSRFPQSGTGVYGPTKSRIRPKTGKALAFTSSLGKPIFRASAKGQPQRRLVPVAGLPSPTWNRALKARAVAFLKKRLEVA